MKALTYLSLICLLTEIGSDALAQGVTGTYSNRQFGYSIRYPAALLRPLSTHSAEGQAFTSLTGHAGFRVYAIHLNGRSAEDVADEAQAICPDRRPSYRIVKPTLAAISCKVGDHIVYQKSLLRRDIAITVRGAYPIAERAKWDPVVTSIAHSMAAADAV
ncbi:MAG: hypothetical protein JO056_03520 [Alphaproteobacteria bacterium]|nr:hypothetical protein [Alphaproteobacteria bacterium]